MSQLDGWVNGLQPHHRALKQIDLTTAKNLAKTWRLGWYVAPQGKQWIIGKMTVVDSFLRLRIADDIGDPLYFQNVEDALNFFRKELGIMAVAMFQT